MKLLGKLHAFGYVVIALLFLVCAFALIVYAGIEIWPGLNPSSSLAIRDRFHAILECIGMLTIAVAALELSQTIMEEEVMRAAQVSTPTRVRRFLSRFMIVVVVSLAIEFLVAVFELLHTDPSQLPYAAMIALGCGVMLAGWALFVRFNVAAEQLEPEALERAKQEDAKVREAEK